MAVVEVDPTGMLVAGYWMLDAGYWILDAGCWMLDAGCWTMYTGNSEYIPFFNGFPYPAQYNRYPFGSSRATVSILINTA
jgi:hypothetical protein